MNTGSAVQWVPLTPPFKRGLSPAAAAEGSEGWGVDESGWVYSLLLSKLEFIPWLLLPNTNAAQALVLFAAASLWKVDRRGGLCGKEEEKLSCREKSPNCSLWLLQEAELPLEAVAGALRPLHTSHLTALLGAALLGWIMQEMLWSIRNAEDWEESSQGMNSFVDKAWHSPGFQLLQKRTWGVERITN